MSHETLVTAQRMIFHTQGYKCFSVENLKG